MPLLTKAEISKASPFKRKNDVVKNYTIFTVLKSTQNKLNPNCEISGSFDNLSVFQITNDFKVT
jgi:hypothetical protein